MTRPIVFDCRSCGRQVAVEPWSRFADSRYCPRCHRRIAAELARPILERFHAQREAAEPPEMPDW